MTECLAKFGAFLRNFAAVLDASYFIYMMPANSPTCVCLREIVWKRSRANWPGTTRSELMISGELCFDGKVEMPAMCR